jgi:hypothetical protein
MDTLLTILENSFVTAALLSIVVFFGRNLILTRLKGAVKLEMDKELEQYKDELKTQSEERLAIIRNNLQQALKEHEIVFSKLHEKQMAILADIYFKAVDFKRAVARYIDYFTFHTPESEPLETREANCLKTMNDFVDYSLKNAIYLKPNHAKNLREFDSKLWEVMNRFKYDLLDAADNKSRLDAWKEIRQLMKTDVQALFEDLEAEGRRILGVIPKI